jgi:DNA primase
VIITLEQALASGRGVERPFTCFEAEHSRPTASVNVAKGVWYCYSCGSKGAVDSNRVPSISELEAMLEPEVACREYPSAWMTTFGVGGYWADRFPMWLCWLFGLGEDPWSGEGTYPVHTPAGRLAGVCRRALSEGPWPKYRYPAHWSASRVLFGAASKADWYPVVVLTEGAADALAVREVGAPGFATYGSHLHHPQVEQVLRLRPSLVLLGQDDDKAGNNGAELAAELLAPHCQVQRVEWGGKDPADLDPWARVAALTTAVTAASYVHTDAEIDSWSIYVNQAVEAYERETA